MGISLGSAYGTISLDASGVRTGVGQARAALGELAAGFREGMAAARAEMSQTEGALGSLGGSLNGLKGIATVALGNLVAQGFGALTSAIGNAAREGLNTVANYERLGFALTSLTTREIYRAGLQERSIAIGRAAAQVSEKQAQATKDMTIAQEGLNLRISSAQHDIAAYNDKIGKIQAGKAKGDITQLRDAIASKEFAIKKANNELDKLNDKLGKAGAAAKESATVYKTVTTETISLADARRMATERVKDELAWVQKLAILSPFTNEQTASAYKTLKTYGFVTDEAQRMTRTLLDFAAGAGLTGDAIEELAYPLGIMAQTGKLNAHYLRMLQIRGMDLQPTLKKFGVTLDDVAESSVNAKDFIKDLMDETDKFFAGSGAAQAGTFAGLINSLHDIKEIAERDVLTPFFDTLRPALQGFVDTLQREGVSTLLQMFGRAMGALAKGPLVLLRAAFSGLSGPMATFEASLKLFKDPLTAMQNTLRTVLPPEVFSGFMRLTGFAKDLRDRLSDSAHPIQTVRVALRDAFGTEAVGIFDSLVSSVQRLRDMFGRLKNALKPVASTVLTLFGRAFEWFAVNVLPALNTGLEWLSRNWETVMSVLKTVAGVLAGGAVAAAFAAIGGVIASLNVPFIALRLAAAALVTAWNNDFGGIRTAVTQAWERIQPALKQFWEWVQAKLPGAIATLRQWLEHTFGPALNTAARFIAEKVVPAIASAVEWLAVHLPPAIEAAAKFWDKTLAPALERGWQFITGPLAKGFENTRKWLEENLPQAIQTAKKAWEDLQPKLEDARKWLEENVPKAIEKANAKWEEFRKKADEVKAWLETNLPKAYESLRKFFEEDLPKAVNTARDNFDTFQRKLEGVRSAAEQIKGALDSVRMWLETELPKAVNAAKAPWDTFRGDLDKMAAAITGGIGKAISDLTTGIGINAGEWNRWHQALENVLLIVDRAIGVLSSFSNFIQAVFSAAAKTLQASVEPLLKPLQHASDEVSKLEGNFKSLQAQIGDLILNGLGKLLEFLGGAFAVGFKKSIDDTLDNINRWAPSIQSALGSVKKFFDDLAATVTKVADAFAKLSGAKPPSPTSPTPPGGGAGPQAQAAQALRAYRTTIAAALDNPGLRSVAAMLSSPSVAGAGAMSAPQYAPVFSPNISVQPAPVIVNLDSETIFERGFTNNRGMAGITRNARRTL